MARYNYQADSQKWTTAAIIFNAGLVAYDLLLIDIGHSKRTANAWLVSMFKAGYLSRQGKRGQGYTYKPTPKFWSEYQHMAEDINLETTARKLAKGGRVDVRILEQKVLL